MFDIKEIGARIARYRRQKNLTQMMLADNLGISFQAVSNWERGESMPDISKLGELSQVLGVSIDILLGNVPPYPADVESVEKNSEVADVKVEISPEVDVKVEVKEDSVEPDEAQREYFRNIMSTVFYMESETIAELVSDLLKQGATFEDISPAIIHMESEDISEVVMECINNGTSLVDLNSAIVHMDSEDITEAVLLAIKNGANLDDVSFAFAYMESEDISEVVKAAIKKGAPEKTKEQHYDELAREVEAKEKHYDKLAAEVEGRTDKVHNKIMNLLSSALTKKPEKQSSESYTVDTETGEVTENSDNAKDFNEMCAMFPFLGEDEVTKLAKEHYEAGTEFNRLSSAFPFMHRNALEEIVICELKKGVSVNELSAVFPFVSIEFMKKIANGEY